MTKFQKEKVLNDTFGINAYGVREMARQYFHLKEMEMHEWSAVDIRLDFEKALASVLLTGEMRLVLALVYAMQLREMQVAKLIGLKVREVKSLIEEAFEIIEAVLNGYRTSYIKFKPSTAARLDEWMEEVRTGQIMPFDIPNAVNDSLLAYLSKTDKQAKEARENKAEDMKDRHLINAGGYDSAVYNFYETSPAVENPMRDKDYIDSKYSGVDAFMDQARHNGLIYMDGDEHSKGLYVSGRKKSKGETDGNDYETGKAYIFTKK